MIYIQSQQTIFPKTIYIGDKAELRCSFSSSAALTTGNLSAESFLDNLDFSLYDLNSVSLQKNGKTGLIVRMEKIFKSNENKEAVNE